MSEAVIVTDPAVLANRKREIAYREKWAAYAAEHERKGDPTPYKYKVRMASLRTVVERPGTPTERRYQLNFAVGSDYAAEAPQVSVALEPADEITKTATAKRAEEIARERASAQQASPEVQALRTQVASQATEMAEMKKLMAEMLANQKRK